MTPSPTRPTADTSGPPAAEVSTAVSPRQARVEQRRAELLQGAIAVIRERGAAASMEELAAGCGVTKPILYRHFGDRDGLVAAIAVWFATDLVLDVAAYIRSDLPPGERVDGAVGEFVAHIERDPALYRFLIQEAPLGGEQFVAGIVAEEVASVLRELLDEAGLDSSGATVWAYGLVGMVQFAGDWWANRQDIPRDEFVAHLTTLIRSGLSGLPGLDFG
jgi:AcrR family transcriptional regulator